MLENLLILSVFLAILCGLFAVLGSIADYFDNKGL